MGERSRAATQPLLDNALTARAHEAIHAVATDILPFAESPFPVLSMPADPRDHLSLFSGWAGVALLYGALEVAYPGHGHGEVAAGMLSQAILAAATADLDASLHGGFVGIAFAIELFAGPGDDEDLNAEVDDRLELILARPWRDADVIDGLAGVGAYLLERHRNGRPRARALLERMVGRLADSARADRDGLVWIGRDGLSALGLAHGNAGVVAVLAKLEALALGSVESRRLLDGGLRWLRSLEQEGPIRFPGAIGRSGKRLAPRHGWCSGDLSIAVAQLLAGQACGDAALVAQAVELATLAANLSPEQGTSFDASLCHGAAGAGHVLHFMYRGTGDAGLAAGARRWFERALALRRPGEGIGGFMIRDGPGERAAGIAHPGLLLGASGTALALLSAIDPGAYATRWDRALLLGDP